MTYLIIYILNGLIHAKVTKQLTKDLNTIKKQNASIQSIKQVKA